MAKKFFEKRCRGLCKTIKIVLDLNYKYSLSMNAFRKRKEELAGEGKTDGEKSGKSVDGGGVRPLTKAEEQVMKVVWQLGNGLLMEIVESMPKPAPHKNTVATILKTLVDKGFVRVENIGRIHRYHPLVSKEAYSRDTLSSVAKGYFEGSFTNVVSFLVDEKKLSVKDLELLLQELKKNKK